jgi:hypothetical protein
MSSRRHDRVCALHTVEAGSTKPIAASALTTNAPSQSHFLIPSPTPAKRLPAKTVATISVQIKARVPERTKETSWCSPGRVSAAASKVGPSRITAAAVWLVARAVIDPKKAKPSALIGQELAPEAPVGTRAVSS